MRAGDRLARQRRGVEDIAPADIDERGDFAVAILE